MYIISGNKWWSRWTKTFPGESGSGKFEKWKVKKRSFTLFRDVQNKMKCPHFFWWAKMVPNCLQFFVVFGFLLSFRAPLCCPCNLGNDWFTIYWHSNWTVLHIWRQITDKINQSRKPTKHRENVNLDIKVGKS